MKKIIFITCLLVSATIFAQTFNKQKLDSLFELINVNKQGMGSISIFKEKKEVYQKSIGFVDLEKNKKANSTTKYRIGSISKTFTAAIILKLVEEKKLTLNTTLNTFFPEINNSDKITIKQLLQHRSGIYNFTDAESYKEWYLNSITKRELVAKIKLYGTSFAPNEKAKYSNSNYVLLALIAEKITDQNFEEILQKYICKPCNLQHTYIGSKINILKNEAQSYDKLADWKKSTATNMSIPIGAGSVIATATDVNKFFNCLFTYKIISKETVDKMKTLKDNYGMGLFQYPYGSQKIYGHTGGIDSFRSMAIYLPKSDVYITYISNGGVMNRNEIVLGALNIYFNKEYKLPTFKETYKITSKELDQYIGIYATPSFPLKITIFKKENTLFGQATGQSSFPLKAVEKNKFKFAQAQISLEFFPKKKTMQFEQRSMKFEFSKE